MVIVGQKAPDFFAPALVGGSGRVIELFAEVDANDAVVLLFAPADFVPACTAEWCGIRDAGWQEEANLAVFGLSGDSLFSHAAYAEQHDIPFPLVSDFHTGIAEQYDLVAEEWEGHRHIAERAAIVIDGDWEIRALETADPLEHVTPAPAARVITVLTDLGFDVSKPVVEYDSFG